MSKRVAPSLGCGYVLVAAIALGGGGALLVAARRFQEAGRQFPPSVWAPAAIGLALLIAAWTYARFARRLVREHAREESRRAAHPAEPWLWRREWLGPHLESADRHAVVAIWLTTILWNAISVPVVVELIRNPPREKLAYLVFLFPLVGLGLLSSAVYQTARARKYGRARFSPVTLPGVIGGHLGGVIEIPARVHVRGDLRLSLRCIRKTVTGSGKNRRVVETAVWESGQRVPPDKLSTAPGGTGIPVLFEIPPGLPATDLDDTDHQIIWRLAAEAETPGVDFATRFHPPVFVVPGLEAAPSPAGGAPGATHNPSAPTPRLDDDALRAAGVERLVDGWRFDARPLRAAKVVFSVIQLGLGALLVVLVARGAPAPAWLIVGFFSLITFVFTYDLLHAGSELRLAGDELLVTDAAWFRRRHRRVPRADVADIHAEDSMSVGQTQYHRLLLIGRPVGDPPSPSRPGEPFATRKLRHQLARASAAEAAALRARLAAAPSFAIRFAGHIPGPSVLAALRAELRARLTER